MGGRNVSVCSLRSLRLICPSALAGAYSLAPAPPTRRGPPLLVLRRGRASRAAGLPSRRSWQRRGGAVQASAEPLVAAVVSAATSLTTAVSAGKDQTQRLHPTASAAPFELCSCALRVCMPRVGSKADQALVLLCNPACPLAPSLPQAPPPSSPASTPWCSPPQWAPPSNSSSSVLLWAGC